MPNRRIRAPFGLLFMMAGIGVSSVAHSQITVYNNFTNGDGFNLGFGQNVTGTPYRGAASIFTVGSTAVNLKNVTVAVSATNSNMFFDIRVVADNFGPDDTHILETFSSLTPNGGFTTTYPAETFNSVATPFLAANTSYWLEVLPTNSSTADVWNLNATGAKSMAVGGSGGLWAVASLATAPAFRVVGTVASVP